MQRIIKQDNDIAAMSLRLLNNTKVLIVILLVGMPLFFFSMQQPKTVPQPLNTAVHPSMSPIPSKLTYDQLEKVLQDDVKQHDPKFALNHLQKQIAGDDDLSNHCHALTHVIGRAAYDKYQIIDDALIFENNLCGSGYLHGVIEERLGKSKDLFADIKSMCKPDDGNCNHGMGHGLMYYTGNDIPKSLLFCDQIKNTRGKLFCSEGVFMENFNTDQQLHPSEYLRNDDPSYPCPQQKEFYKGTCYFYAPDFFLNIHQGAYKEALDWCHTIEEDFRLICINGVGSRTMKRNINNPKLVENVCMTLDHDEQRFCIDGMTSYYVVNYYSLSKAKAMCDTLQTENKETCLHAVTIRNGMFPD